MPQARFTHWELVEDIQLQKNPSSELNSFGRVGETQYNYLLLTKFSSLLCSLTLNRPPPGNFLMCHDYSGKNEYQKVF